MAGHIVNIIAINAAVNQVISLLNLAGILFWYVQEGTAIKYEEKGGFKVGLV